MNTLFTKILPMIAGSVIFASGCSSDNSTFETPNTSTTPLNGGTVSQKNLSILAEDTQPMIYENGVATDTTLVMTVKIGDSSNQVLTDTHTVFFATEWGLIEPSCVTENGTCNVNWQTSFGPGTVPADHLVTIVAYTLGEEDFSDTNGNGKFDDNDQPFPASADLFIDREEPFVDADRDGIFNSGDTIIDVMDGNVVGTNGVHDDPDGFLNSPNCTHSSLCSMVSPTIYIWDDIQINMDGPPPATP